MIEAEYIWENQYRILVSFYYSNEEKYAYPFSSPVSAEGFTLLYQFLVLKRPGKIARLVLSARKRLFLRTQLQDAFHRRLATEL